MSSVKELSRSPLIELETPAILNPDERLILCQASPLLFDALSFNTMPFETNKIYVHLGWHEKFMNYS